MPLTIKWIGSPNFNTQNGIQKRHITLHWIVGHLSAADATFQRPDGVSATYGIEGATVHQYVKEKDYPYSDGNTEGNRYGVSIEHAGGWLLPDGSRFKPTPATHETSAQLCAEIAGRWNLGKLAVGVNVFRHSHWVATMCPGTLDVEWIVARANEIMGYKPRTKDDVRRVAAYLNSRKLGKTSTSASDGIPGPNLYWMIQKAGQIDKIYGGPIDGVTGPNTEKAFDHFVKVTAPKPPVVEPAEPEPPVVIPPVEPEPPVQPPVEPPVEPAPTDPPIEPPAPEKPPAPKPVNMLAVIITAIIGVGTLIAGIITGLIR